MSAPEYRKKFYRAAREAFENFAVKLAIAALAILGGGSEVLNLIQ